MKAKGQMMLLHYLFNNDQNKYLIFVCNVEPSTDVETLLGDLTSLTVEDKS